MDPWSQNALLIAQVAVTACMLGGLLFFLYAQKWVRAEYLPVIWANVVVQLAGVLVYLAVILEGRGIGDWVMDLETRYAYWLLTTPFLVALFPMLLRSRAVTRALALKLVSADLVMLAAGYWGEQAMDAPGSNLAPVPVLAFAIGALAFAYIILELVINTGLSARHEHGSTRRGLMGLALLLAVGWSLYPAIYLMEMFGDHAASAALDFWSELAYLAGNLINKLVLGLVAVMIAIQLSAIGDYAYTGERVWGKEKI